MSEPLNPERTHLDRLIAEEKLLWKSKVEDGLSWEQTATVFEEKFHRPRGLPGLEQRLNRLKETKAQMAEVDLTLFVSSC
jgi:transposase